jgi:2-deoxy-D-gluconate 3-dehydrogenase
MTLDGATALVTGASSGLGAAVARALAGEGAAVAVTELEERLTEAQLLVQDLVRDGGEAIAIPLDVRDPDAVGRCVAAVVEWRGSVDVLVSNAGLTIRRPALEVTPDEWDEVLAVNLRGAFLVAQAVARVMQAREPAGGAIVNVASIMGLVGGEDRAAYCASKGGLVNLTRALAVEWAPLRIRVNAVCPTFADTPLTRPLFDARPEALAEIERRTPLGRLVTPEEVAEAIVYLAGAEMVTGSVLAVDGGWTAQ